MSRSRRRWGSCAREWRVGLCRRKGKICRRRCGRRKMLSRSQRVLSFRSTSTTLRARRIRRATRLSQSRRRSLPTLRSQSPTETLFAVSFSSPTSRKSTRLATMIDWANILLTYFKTLSVFMKFFLFWQNVVMIFSAVNILIEFANDQKEDLIVYSIHLDISYH